MRVRSAFHLMMLAALAAGVVAVPTAGSARSTSVLTDDPYPCTVLSPFPCHPSFCSVFSREPCQPEISYSFGLGLRLTIASRATGEPDKGAAAPKPARRQDDGRLSTIGDLFA